MLCKYILCKSIFKIQQDIISAVIQSFVIYHLYFYNLGHTLPQKEEKKQKSENKVEKKWEDKRKE